LIKKLAECFVALLEKLDRDKERNKEVNVESNKERKKDRKLK
jgi:hypothetical protein